MLPGNSSISPCIALRQPWMRLMPSDSETTVPCVRTSAPVSRFWILLLISSLISDGFNCMFFPRAWPRSASRAASRQFRNLDGRNWFAIACNSPCTEASITVSPTTIFAPPISARSTLTVVSIFLPKRRSQCPCAARQLGVVEREGADDLRPRDAVGLVLQRVEQACGSPAAGRCDPLRSARG